MTPVVAAARKASGLLLSLGLASWFLYRDLEEVRLRLHFDPALFWPGSDARIYFRAASAWVTGGDPWHATFGGIAFGAPPPTLLTIAPFVLLGEEWTVRVWLVGGVTLALFALRRIGLPPWWLLFPPLFQCLWVGNPNTAVLALLLVRWEPLAVFAKVYAIVPAFLLGRWRAVAWSVALLVVTAPFIGWPAYLDHGLSVIDAQARGYSAWTDPWQLVPVVAIALLVIPRDKAAWLAVPGLWPFTQLGYGVLALPAMSPLLAVAFSMRQPWAVSAGIGLYALVEGQIPSIVSRYDFKSAAVSVPRYETTTY